MGRSPIAVRVINTEELAVLEQALLSAPANGSAPPSLDRLGSLQVVGKCHCGCASVNFRRLKPGEIAEVVADAVGETPSGEQVGVLVFAISGALIGLEIVGYSDMPAQLPIASTVRGWDSHG
jgi:hypothetical protein